jgi:uncharacterized protein YjbI with pentapeptide repeats
VGLESPASPNGDPVFVPGEAASAEMPPATLPPKAPVPAPAALAPAVQPIAAKADDLEALRKAMEGGAAVEDAATVGGGWWLSYLFVLFYLAITAGAVTHADLFFENPVTLPFLNIKLPLLAFFFLAPIFFVIVHAYTLVHLVLLTDKAKWFHQLLQAEIRNEDGLPEGELTRRAEIRAGMQRRLPNNIFVQLFAGPPQVRASAFGWLLRAIAWSSLVVAPVLLLLLMQIQFLPFHSLAIAWTQRTALLADLGLIWWLWRKILSGREIDGGSRRASGVWPGLGLALSAGAVLFSWTAATFPGEWQERHWPDWRPFPVADRDGRPTKVSFHDWVFNLPVDDTTRRRKSLFSSTLVLPGLNIYEGLDIDDPKKAEWHEFVFRARGRDLKGAIFDLASLPKVDFTGAELQAASLFRAQLQGASFDHAQLQGASLAQAELQGAPLEQAQLQGASLDGAKLEGAKLIWAQLQGANLDNAELRGASLAFAQLMDASFYQAKLEGANLEYARLQGASLLGSNLEAATLFAAELQGASLEYAELQGASLRFANLQGTELSHARLEGASLRRAELQGAQLQDAHLQATDLSNAFLWRTSASAHVANVRFLDSADIWRPVWRDEKGKVHPWNEKSYADLRQMIESLEPNYERDKAMDRIGSLNCSNPDTTLSSCDPSAVQPSEAAAWRNTLEAASVIDSHYAKALAAELKALVCSGDDDAAHVLRGLLPIDGLMIIEEAASTDDPDRVSDLSSSIEPRLAATGAEAPALVDFIMSKDCPASASLTDADKAKLLRIKQDAIAKQGG